MFRTAELRGVSVEELKKSAKNLNLAAKCSRSVYRKPFDAIKHKKSQQDGWVKHNKSAQLQAAKKKLQVV